MNESPLRVLHLFSGREGGGIGRVMIPLLRRLPERGVEVIVVLLQEGALQQRLEDAGIAAHIVGRHFPGDPSVAFRVARIARQNRCHWIHTHGISSNFYGRLASLFPATPPVVTTVHAFTFDELRGAVGWRAGLMYRLDLAMHRRAQRVIAISNALREALIAKGVPADKIVTIPHGIEVDAYRTAESEVDALRNHLALPSGAVVAGIVGRLTAVKNHELFLQAASRVAERLPEARFLVIGSGPLEKKIKEQAERLGLRERLVFTGWVSPVVPWIRLLDVMVMTSRSEGFGMAVLESMACGVPVVSVRVSEIPAILGESSLLVEPDDADELSERMISLLSDQARRAEIGARLRRRVEERYRFERVLSQHLTVYRQ